MNRIEELKDLRETLEDSLLSHNISSSREGKITRIISKINKRVGKPKSNDKDFSLYLIESKEEDEFGQDEYSYGGWRDGYQLDDEENWGTMVD